MLLTNSIITNTFNINFNIMPFNLEYCVFFDIETTGLSSTNHMIYLIGALVYSNHSWQFLQYLATNLDDEREIIAEFFKLISNKKYLIHYNGNHFDIPFINKRATKHQLHSPISTLESIDLYKICKSLTPFLKLKNYKLCTVTNAFNITREDKLSGKELINVYYDFIKSYSLDLLKNDFNKSNSYKRLLLLHNYEDIINLPPLLNLYSYKYVQQGNFIVNSFTTDNNLLTINCSLQNTLCKYFLPIDINYTHNSHNNYHIISNGSNLIFKIPVLTQELKFFYSDYKNYYYLPDEDTAIHKSVGQYVDKEHRTKATASNCYVKRLSNYICTLTNPLNVPIFKEDLHSKLSYIELTPSILNTDNLKLYILDILSSI